MSDPAEILREAVVAAAGGAPVAVVTAMAGEGVTPGAKLLVRADASTAGTLGSRDADATALRAGTTALEARPREAVRAVTAGGVRLLVEVFETPATLLVVGGGHIGLSLATIGAHAGFQVTVLDDREEYANEARFPMAGRVICGDFAEELRRMDIDGATYVVLVTRGHKQDELTLRHVVRSPAAYVGMIGSRRRVRAVLQHLRDEGVPEDALARVYTPIGLDIGAETPEEIAVSIIAQVVQVRRGGSGRPLALASHKRARSEAP